MFDGFSYDPRYELLKEQIIKITYPQTYGKPWENQQKQLQTHKNHRKTNNNTQQHVKNTGKPTQTSKTHTYKNLRETTFY